MGGIYCIRNIENNKMYIGSTHNFSERKYRHFHQLEIGKHHSILLQRAYDKYGKESFVFEILKECSDEEDLLKTEQYFLDKYQPFAPNGYNISTIATNCVLYGENNGMYGRKGKDNPNYGRKNTKETLEKMSKAQKGKPKSEEAKKNLSIAIKKQYENGRVHFNKGKHLSQDQKDKIKEKRSIPVKQIDKNTLNIINIFENALVASGKLGIDNSMISKCCKHKPHSNTAGGYKWEYATKDEYNNFIKDNR